MAAWIELPACRSCLSYFHEPACMSHRASKALEPAASHRNRAPPHLHRTSSYRNEHPAPGRMRLLPPAKKECSGRIRPRLACSWWQEDRLPIHRVPRPAASRVRRGWADTHWNDGAAVRIAAGQGAPGLVRLGRPTCTRSRTMGSSTPPYRRIRLTFACCCCGIAPTPTAPASCSPPCSTIHASVAVTLLRHGAGVALACACTRGRRSPRNWEIDGKAHGWVGEPLAGVTAQLWGPTD